MPVKISIIIPTYRRHASLERTLTSIAQYKPADSEIIIVDQSPDNKVQSNLLSKKFPFTKYIRLSKPSLPNARNKGIINSSGNIILFLDDDATVHPDCFNEHLAAHAQNDIGVVAGRIKQMNENVSWAETSIVASIDSQTGETSGNFDLDYEGDVLYATGGHMSIKRDVFKNAGLFNTFFIGNALFEDIEFSLRIRKRGYSIKYNPRAIISHYPDNKGGCHESDKTHYLLERLYNHILFFTLHNNVIPSKEFFIYIKNLMEYISRRDNDSHSIVKFCLCLLFVFKAYVNSGISFLYNPKLSG